MTAVASSMKNEQRLLNLICLIAALGLFAFIGYNFLAAGYVISTDGLFFTVVPLVIAICFLAVPLQPIVTRRVAKLLGTGDHTAAVAAPAVVGSKTTVGGTVVSAGRPRVPLKSAPVLRDPKGRALPPDVNRMVAEMQKPVSGEQ